MAEAIISRATYIPEQIDPTVSKFVMYLKSNGGIPVAGMKVGLNDAGEIYEYSTDSNGSITIFPKSGWANINVSNVFENGLIIADQKVKSDNSWYNFEAPLGKKTIEEIKYDKFNENELMSYSNGNYRFYDALSVDLNLSGGGGGGACTNQGSWVATGGSGYTTKVNNYIIGSDISIIVGVGGAGGTVSYFSNGVTKSAPGNAGGTTYFNDIFANGGSGGTWTIGAGGDGASGGAHGSFGNGKRGSDGWCKVTLHY